MAKKGELKANATKRSKQQRKYNSKPEQKKNRAARNKARRAAVSKGKASKGDGKDIGHKKALANGGSKKLSNTRVESRSSNRSNGGRIGGKRGKGSKKK